MGLGYHISLFETSAELPFICYSSIFVGLLWEGLEEIAEKFTPRVINVFFWIKKQESGSNSNNTMSKIDPRAVERASDNVLKNMKDMINNVYSEDTAREISKEVGKYQLTKKEQS